MIKRALDRDFRTVRYASSAKSWLVASFVISLSASACTDDSGLPVEADARVPDGGNPGAGDGGTDAGMDARVDAGADGAAEAAVDAAPGDGSEPPIDGTTVEQDGSAGDGDARTDDASGEAGLGGVGAPALMTAEARQVGRFGGSLRIDVTAVRGERTIVALDVQLLNGQRVSVGPSRSIPLVEVISELTGGSFVLLEGTFERYSEVATARVSLIDEAGDSSTPRELAVVQQPVIQSGSACDDTFLTNRCASNLGCKGPTPNTCQASVAPALSRAGFFVDELGPRIVFEGTDPDADVVGYRMEFLDENGDPVFINHDSEDSSPAVSEVTGSTPVQTNGAYFARFSPSDVLVTSVASVRLSTVDDADNVSNSLVADRSEAPTRGLGLSCDERTFNRCSDGASCSYFGDQNRCALPEEAQLSSCTAALVLNPKAGPTRVRGSLRSSLWEPPAGCAFGQVAKQPDRVVKLVLPEAVSQLTLSTDHPYTGFDTDLYVLSSCSGTPTLPWCVADQPAPSTDPRAVLTLQNLVAGEYYVVVDSFPSPGFDATSDTFELTVEVD